MFWQLHPVNNYTGLYNIVNNKLKYIFLGIFYKKSAKTRQSSVAKRNHKYYLVNFLGIEAYMNPFCSAKTFSRLRNCLILLNLIFPTVEDLVKPFRIVGKIALIHKLLQKWSRRQLWPGLILIVWCVRIIVIANLPHPVKCQAPRGSEVQGTSTVIYNLII